MFIRNAMNTNTIPSASAREKLPLEVSSGIAVVSVLVYPSMLPPTMTERPTSDMARPKPMTMAVITANLASLVQILYACILLAPREVAVSIVDLSKPLRAEITRPSITGVTSNIWPTTIPFGSNRSPKEPNGPDRRTSMTTIRPTATVGMLYSVCMMLIRRSLPLNRLKCIRLPRGMHITIQTAQEAAAIHSDLHAICTTSGSNVTRR